MKVNTATGNESPVTTESTTDAIETFVTAVTAALSDAGADESTVTSVEETPDDGEEPDFDDAKGGGPPVATDPDTRRQFLSPSVRLAVNRLLFVSPGWVDESTIAAGVVVLLNCLGFDGVGVVRGIRSRRRS